MRKKHLDLSLSLSQKGESLLLGNVIELYLFRLGYQDQTQALKIKQFLYELFPKAIADRIKNIKKVEKILYLSISSPAVKHEINLMSDQLKKRILQELHIELDKINFCE